MILPILLSIAKEKRERARGHSLSSFAQRNGLSKQRKAPPRGTTLIFCAAKWPQRENRQREKPRQAKQTQAKPNRRRRRGKTGRENRVTGRDLGAIVKKLSGKGADSQNQSPHKMAGKCWRGLTWRSQISASWWEMTWEWRWLHWEWSQRSWRRWWWWWRVFWWALHWDWVWWWEDWCKKNKHNKHKHEQKNKHDRNIEHNNHMHQFQNHMHKTDNHMHSFGSAAGRFTVCLQ